MKKPIERRNTETSLETDYTELYELMFGENSGAINAEPEEKTNRALAKLEPFARFCFEEKFLRGTLDMKEFVVKYLDGMVESLRELFLGKVSEIFGKMRANNFNELKYLDKQPAFSPKPELYYEKGAFKSAADVLRIAIDKYERDGKRFEDAYTDAEFDELRDLFIEEMDEIFGGIKDNDFYELDFSDDEYDFLPIQDERCESDAFMSNVDILRGCVKVYSEESS